MEKSKRIVRNPEDRIGEVINGRTIIAVIREGKPVRLKFKLKCECGSESILSLDKIKDRQCRNCYEENRSKKHIGEKYDKSLIIGLEKINGHNQFKVRCDCGNEYVAKLNHIKNTDGCRNCLRKFFPGMVIEGCTLLEKVNKRNWKILCKCGNEYISYPRKDKRKNGLVFRDCGCDFSNNYFEKAKEKIGYKFGKLKVIDIEKGKRHNILICKCKCGNLKKVVNGHECKLNSCGCLKKENIPRGEKKGNAKYTASEINSIREFHSSKTYSFEELKEMFGMSANYLTRILKGYIWKSLPNFEQNIKKRQRPKGLVYKSKKST